MKEKKYIQPRITVIKIESEALLELSLGVSENNYATTGGDAKQDLFNDAETDSENINNVGYNTWEE